MMKSNFIFVFILIFTYFLSSSAQVQLIKKIDLEKIGILKPQIMKVKDGNIYIYDTANSMFYKINKEFKVERKFGKKGEGPGELRNPIGFYIYKNRIYINDIGKTIECDLNYNFIKENKSNLISNTFKFILDRIDNNTFISEKMGVKEDKIINSLELNLKERTIKLSDSVMDIRSKIDLNNKINFSYSIGKEKCYIVPDVRNFYIKSFDLKEHKFKNFLKIADYKREHYNKEETEEMKENLKRIKRSNPYLERFHIKPPALKPAINDIIADKKDNLYIVTYTNKKDKLKIEVYSHNIRPIKTFLIPDYKLIDVEKDKMFLVIEDEIYYLFVYNLDI